MTATDELRAMLDERGANWDYGITGAATTKFSANGVDLTFMPMRDGLVCTTILTPAQAIAATLGESMTDTEKAALERRIDELCAEVEYNRQTSRSRLERIDQLKDENAKLRELEGHMLRCMKRNSDCDYCLANGEHCEISYIEADALELGIEVPDGEV